MTSLRRLVRAAGAAAAIAGTATAWRPHDWAAALDRASLVNVRSLGATGNGTTDDTSAFKTALARAARKWTGIYVPAGTYRVSRFSLSSAIVVDGVGCSIAWIQDVLSFGSHTKVSDLKIGVATSRSAT
jgi:Pectate lyase superfamily protein